MFEQHSYLKKDFNITTPLLFAALLREQLPRIGVSQVYKQITLRLANDESQAPNLHRQSNSTVN